MPSPGNPENYPSRVLLVVCGQTPQVITETVQGLILRSRPFVPSRIVVITTGVGKAGIIDRLCKEGKFAALCDDLVARHLPDVDLVGLSFDEYSIRVPTNAAGVEDDDAHSEVALERMGDLILKTLCEFAADDTAIHVSLAGGRKSMSYLAGLALSLMGRAQDRLSHVLLSDPRFESCPEFYFSPREPVALAVRPPGESESMRLWTSGVRVMLSNVPFVRTRYLLGERALVDPARPVQLSQLVAEANAALLNEGEHTLTFDTCEGKAWCDGVEVDLTQDEFAFYYALAKFGEEGRALTTRPSDDDCDRYLELRAHVTPGGVHCRCEQGWRDAMQGPYHALFGKNSFGDPSRLENLTNSDDIDALNNIRGAFFSPKRTTTNKKLINALGRIAAAPFLVQSAGGRGGRPATYSLNSEVQIEWRNARPRREI